MATRLRFERLPLDSSAPLFWFALIRVAIVVAVLASSLALGFPYGGQLVAIVAGLGLPWSLALLWAARRHPNLAINPIVALGDFGVLIAIEIVVPETYGANRFVALFMVAAHAHFQGERVGSAVAATGVLALVIVSALVDDPLDSELLAFYESVFVVTAIAMALVIGYLRSAESAGRLRARELTRRTFAAEDAVRRRLAESIHDGPVQELVSLEMILTAARDAGGRGDAELVAELLAEAEGMAARNVHALRDEILSLGPHAFEELSFEAAVTESVPLWERRYHVPIDLECERVELASEQEGALFRITQEAVANAARHAKASRIVVRLQNVGHHVELAISDDGSGFSDVGLLRRAEPGHLGLAGMRERAATVGGRLEVATGQSGTTVRVIVPLRR